MATEGESANGQPAGATNVNSTPTETPSGPSGPQWGDTKPADVVLTPDAIVSLSAESPSAGRDPNSTPAPSATVPAKKETVVPDKSRPWHEELAEKYGVTDDGVLKKMQRYESFGEYAKSVKELERKLSSGERGKLPDSPTEEQLKEWREANGIPTSLEGYDSAFDVGEGFVVGDDDKAALTERLIKPLLENNAKPEIAKTAVKAFFDYISDTAKTFQERDRQVQLELKEEWGDKYERNKGQIETLLSTHFGESADRLRGILGNDGKGFAIADKGVLNAFLSIADRLNPKDVVPPPQSTDSSKANTRLQEIEKYRKERWNDYQSNSKADVAMRKEYVQLLAATMATRR